MKKISKKRKQNENRKKKNERAVDGREKAERDHIRSRPFDEMRKDAGGSIRSKTTDHANPLSKRKVHKTMNRGRSPRTMEVPQGQTPRTHRRMVPWVQNPKQASPTDYVLVLREMLEGDVTDPRLGLRQLELHDILKILTQTPRCREDFRHVISVLRLLYEQNIIDESFIENVIVEHPLLGHRNVKMQDDTEVVNDYIRELKNAPNKDWEEQAEYRYKAIVKSMKKTFVRLEREKYPDAKLTESDILKHWKEPEKVPYKSKEGEPAVWLTKDEVIARYKRDRLTKEASKLPRLSRLYGEVWIWKRSKKDATKTVCYRDVVDIEIAHKPDGGLWLGIAKTVGKKGKRKKRVSPFRKQFCKLPGGHKLPSHIDGEYIPKVHDRGIVQNQPDSGDVPDENAPLSEVAKHMNIPFKDDRRNNAGGKTRKSKTKAKRQTKPKRGTPRKGRPKRDDDDEEGGVAPIIVS